MDLQPEPEHGLAPSRQQILAQALSHIPAEAPEQIRASLTLFVTGAPRKQGNGWPALDGGGAPELACCLLERMCRFPFGSRRRAKFETIFA